MPPGSGYVSGHRWGGVVPRSLAASLLRTCPLANSSLPETSQSHTWQRPPTSRGTELSSPAQKPRGPAQSWMEGGTRQGPARTQVNPRSTLPSCGQKTAQVRVRAQAGQVLTSKAETSNGR